MRILQWYVICNIKITYQCKILIVPEEGWFGQPKYSTPTKKSFYVVSTSAPLFFVEKDHLSDWSPEKHCCLRLTFRQPVRNNDFQRNKGYLESVFVTVRSIAIIQGVYNVSEISLQIF